MRAEAVRTDRLATTLCGVDTLVAVPQWYLNFNLANLLKHGKNTDGKPLSGVALSYDGGSRWLKGTIDKLWTNVHVPDSPTRVKFVLHFSDGTLDYVDNTVKPTVEGSCDIGGLQFGFEVNLSRAAVAQDASLPDDVKKRVDELLGSLGSGAFSIQQVFMDLQNAALDQYDRSTTVFPTAMPKAAVNVLPGYVAQYLAQLAEAGGDVLGYAITVGHGVDMPATFPPTELRFATNQYQGGDDGKTLTPDLDTLNYRLITKDGAFPVNPQPWWGNFVVPGDIQSGWYGTLALSSRLFIRDFLLPRLAPIVLGYLTFSDRDGSIDPDYQAQTGTFTPTQYGGFWESGTYSARSHRTNTFSNDDVDYSMRVSVQLSVLPGTNTIAISRETHFDIHYTHWYGVDGHAASSDYHVWYQVPLNVTIKLIGAQDGKLQVSATATTREPDPNVQYGDPYGWDIVDQAGSYSGWGSISDDMDAAIAAMVSVAAPEALLPGVGKSITDDLNLKPFVFPGSSQLFLANPVFNGEGDLLLGLQYKV
jgi:hypothetical protein